MGTEIADVVIALRAKNDELERDLTTARQQLKKFSQEGSSDLSGVGKAFSSAFAGIRSVAGGLGLAFGSAQLARFVKDTVSAASNLVDLSDAMGVTTDQLQKLHFAADLAGVNVGALDTAIGMLSKNASSAVNGNTQLEATFEALGVNLTKNRELLNDLPTLLVKVLQGTDRLGSSAEKNAVRLQIFGKSALDLGSLAARGGAQLIQAFEDFERLHLGVSREDLDRLDQAGDAVTRLGTTVRAEINKIVAAANSGGALTRFADSITDSIVTLVDKLRAVSSAQTPEGALSGVDKQIAALEKQSDAASDATQQAIADLKAFRAEIVATIEAQKRAGPATFFLEHSTRADILTPEGAPPKLPEGPEEKALREKRARDAAEAKRRLDELKAKGLDLQKTVDSFQIPEGYLRDLAQVRADYEGDVAAALALKTIAEQSQGVLNAALKARAAELALQAKAEKDAADALEKASLDAQQNAVNREPADQRPFDSQRIQAIAEFQKQVQAGRESGSQKAIDDANAAFEKTMDNIAEAEKQSKSFTHFLETNAAGAVQDFGTQLSVLFTNWISGQRGAQASFKQLVATTLAGLARIIAQTVILIQLKNALKAAGSGLTGAGFGGLGGIFTAIGGAISAADGGIFSRPTRAIVGDAGAGNPEVVAPLSKLADMMPRDAGTLASFEIVLNNNGPPLTARPSGTGIGTSGKRRAILELDSAQADSVALGGKLARTIEQRYGFRPIGVRRG